MPFVAGDGSPQTEQPGYHAAALSLDPTAEIRGGGIAEDGSMIPLLLAVNTASSSYQVGQLAGMLFGAALMFVLLFKMVQSALRD